MDNASELNSVTVLESEDGLEPSGPDVGMKINAVLKIIFYISVMILGICGNILILGVYWSKPHKTTTHVLIMSLAWIDLIVCLLRIHNLAIFISVLLGRDTPSFFAYVGVVSATNVFASFVVTGVIAVERYDCVCRPRNRLLNHRRTKLMVLCSYAAAVVVAVPLSIDTFAPSPLAKKTALAFQLALYLAAVLMIVICYGYVYRAIRTHVKVNVFGRRRAENHRSTTVDDTLASVTGSTISATIPIPNDKMPSQACHSSTGIWVVSPAALHEPSTSARPAVPCKLSAADHNPTAETTGGNGMPAPQGEAKPAVRPARKRLIANPHSGENSDGPTTTLQRKTTRMLFVTSVVFLVTWFPYWLYVAVAFYKYSGGNVHDNVLSVMYYCTLSVYVNNVVNPFIYGLSNRRFRKDCVNVLRKFKPC